jgi:hypothetical protein
MNDRKAAQEHDDLDSPTMEYVRELVAKLDPEIFHVDPEDAPTAKL